MQTNNRNNKQLDSYSLLICSKYFKTSLDYINIICVNSKFKETTEKLRFNPIPITSLKLFPKIQTQYLYSDKDTKIEGIENYELRYNVNYYQYLKYKQDNIKCHKVVYSRSNRFMYGDKIPKEVNILGEKCFGSSSQKRNDASRIKELTIPSKITSLNERCFSCCFLLTSITLPSTITSLGDGCFYLCLSLKLINLPSSLNSLSIECFKKCTALIEINLPTTLTSISRRCFSECSKLSSINLPSSLITLGCGCFYKCDQLKGKINIPDYCFEESFKLNQFN
ncbi:Leucine rich repeat containing protein BspA family protein [Entamoeba marina]